MKKIFTILLITIILVSTSGIIVTSKAIEKKSDIIALGPHIIIPDHFSTIQEGIDNANPGEVIFVRSGIYKENILIDKEGLYILGENKYTTIIDGDNKTDTITISSQYVTIESVTIQHGYETNKWDAAGINILRSNITIKNNIIKNNLIGINGLDTARNITIIDNKFYNDSILLCNSERTFYSFIKDKFYHTIENNTVNGKPIYFYKNTKDIIVPTNAGMVYIANCSNMTIKDCDFTNCDFPIIIEFSNNCIVENVAVEHTYGEIIALHSENCTFQNNTIIDQIMGICLDYGSKNNIIRYNYVLGSYAGIVVMTKSNNNQVYQNTIYQNKALGGIFLYNKSHNNKIYENKLVGNIYGIRLSLSPYDNEIYNNTIKRSLIPVLSLGKTTNNWNHNYYNILHIFNKRIFSFNMLFDKFPIPNGITGIDKNPAIFPPVK